MAVIVAGEIAATEKLPVSKTLTVSEFGEASKAVKSLEKGKLNIRVNTATEAKKVLQERGNMNRYKNYTRKSYVKGYEVHNVQNSRELSVGNNLQHIKWYDGKAQGHIFYNKPN